MASPRALNATPVGYQPVGINPATRPAPGFDTSTTATLLLSAFATSSLLPSGESASALGVDPGGACGNNATEICSTAFISHGSIAYTAFVFAQATNNRPSGASTM